MNASELKDKFVKLNLSKGAKDDIFKFIKSSIFLKIKLHRFLPEEIGQTKIGGLPDFPKNLDWPMLEDTPLSFVAQINLKDISNFFNNDLLPKSGMLYFFALPYENYELYTYEDPKYKVVYYNVNPEDLNRNFRHQELVDIFFPNKIVFKNMETVPPLESDEYYNFQEALLKHNILNLDDIEDYSECVIEGDRIFGYSYEIQSDMLNELKRYEDSEWLLLLQIDSDKENGNMMWGDCGSIYFWIKKQDLLDKKFDQVKLISQDC